MCEGPTCQRSYAYLCITRGLRMIKKVTSRCDAWDGYRIFRFNVACCSVCAHCVEKYNMLPLLVLAPRTYCWTVGPTSSINFGVGVAQPSLVSCCCSHSLDMAGTLWLCRARSWREKRRSKTKSVAQWMFFNGWLVLQKLFAPEPLNHSFWSCTFPRFPRLERLGGRQWKDGSTQSCTIHCRACRAS